MAGDTDPVVPVFPLGTVLLPGAPQALHVFEPRYRAMLAEVTSGDRPRRAFGIVSLHRGLEAGVTVNTVLSDIGTLAEILDLRRYDDGTADLLTVGSRRFRVLEIGETPSGYLRARVEWLGEPEGRIRAGDVAAAQDQVELYRDLLSRLLERDDDLEPLPTDPVRLSYALALRLQLSVADRQRLLAAPDAAGRIRMAMALLRRETVLLQRTRSVPVPLQTLALASGSN